MLYSEEIKVLGDRIYNLQSNVASELVDYLKEVHHIEASIVPKFEKPKEEEVKVVEKTEFDVVLESFNINKKIPLVKALREIISLGLKDAMAAVNALPYTVKNCLPKAEAEKLKSLLEECGGKVVLK